MKEKSPPVKQGFLFKFKWLNRMSRLTATQKILLLETMNAYAQNQDISLFLKKMQEKTMIVWEMIQEELLEDMLAYDTKVTILRENARKGGKASAAKREASKSKQMVPNGSNFNQMVPNGSNFNQKQPKATKSNQIEPDNNNININTKLNNKEKIYKKEIMDLLSEKFVDEEVVGKFVDFLNMRAGLGNNKEVTTIETFEALVEKLKKLASNKEEALQVLNNSIINNLTDLYPIKNKKKESGGVQYAN